MKLAHDSALGGDPALAGARLPGDVAAPSTYVLQARALCKRYDTPGGALEVLRGIDLAVARSESIALKGVSGSGKSTLLHILGAIDRPSSGSVQVLGTALEGLSTREQTAFRARHVGFVFQFFNLVPTLTALENVVAGLEPLPGTRRGRQEAAAAALAAVGLADKADAYPAQLSGGQQQRVAIARAVAKRPTLILADEPTGALDPATAMQVLALLNRLRREHGCAVVIATHDQLVAGHVDRVLRLEAGRVTTEGHAR